MSSLGLGLPACESPAAHSDGAPLVRVDKVAITKADLDRAIAREPEAARQKYKDVAARRQLLEGLVKFEVMAQAAEAAGAMSDPEVVRAFKHQGIQKFIQDQIGAATSAEAISSHEVQSFYESHKAERYVQPGAVQARQHVFKDEATAAAFARIPNAAKGVEGTDLGFVDGSSPLPPAIKAAALGLTEAHAVSSPVQTPQGFAVLTLRARRAEVVVPLADVETAIRQELQRKKREEALEALIKAAQQRTQVQWVKTP